MNRIYQGRVASVQIVNPNEESRKKDHWVALDTDTIRARELGEAALWNHHQLFQDAVNYYIVALASLGISPESKLTKLRELLAKVWDTADKRGQRRNGMSDSLQRAWQLEKAPTLSEAVERFRKPLLDDLVPLPTAEKAGEFLLFNLGGDAAIQQGGRVFFPMFCDIEDASTYRLSVTRRGRTENEERLRAELHRELSPQQIRDLAKSVTLGSVVNLQPNDTPDTGAPVVERLQEAAASFRDQISEQQFSEWVKELPTDFALPKNRGGNINKARVYACILFLAFPNAVTKGLFQATFPAPKQPRTRTVKRSPDGDVIDESHFIVDGDDPIKLARGTRGWVFLGFTALPLWQGDGRMLHWKMFDIAAFKEALKVYNQFQQNVEAREAKLNVLATKLLVMDGERAIDAYAAGTDQDQKMRSRLARIWAETNGKPKPPTNENGEETVLARFTSDPRIDRLRQIVNADLAEEYRLTDGRLTPYGLRRRTMKGWNDVKRCWQFLVRSGTTFSGETRAKLQAKLDELRSGEKREQIGSHRLFEALISDEDAWSIWREPSGKQTEQIVQKCWAVDPLEAFREYCETRETFEEVSSRPLNFTPADARFSRRLFLFTDACSFGSDHGEYRHDFKEMAVTVPLAWKDESGRYSVQPIRLGYSAPRLLRDNIRAEDGSYVQNWVQPMMRALFGTVEEVPNRQELKDAAVQLMPDFNGKGQRRILLNFPLTLEPAPCWSHVYALRKQQSLFAIRFSKTDKKRKKPINGGLWESNIRTFWEGDSPRRRDFLYWPTDERRMPEWSKGNWWQKVDSFRVLAADLGTRHAASIALIDVGLAKRATSRFIGEADGRKWYACYRTGAILRLPGENTRVLRPRSRLDEDDEELAFREELYGERGRRATSYECGETIGFLRELGQLELLGDAVEPLELLTRFSFPEQNDKLLVALRRRQSWIATCVSWHWKLTQPDSAEQQRAVLVMIADQVRMSEWKQIAQDGAPKVSYLRDVIRDHIIQQREIVYRRLLELTHRILPLRGRAWEWVIHPEKADCRLLRQAALGTANAKTLLSGQRGLSIARIEQMSELRRRWQSLNQSLRRELGQKPLTASEMRSDPIPDPCPDILRKLENIREQRVNQTAHLILAQALGLRLREPTIAPESRRALDFHGEYEVARPPVDMIVLEDLSRYLSDQGRAKSENTRLMKWCHRAITQKVKMLAEPFGIPVLETPAAYSSRFCSLTGTAGFRAAEVGWNDRHEFRWRVLLEEAKQARAEHKEPSAIAKNAETLFGQLEEIDKSMQPHRTLLAPQQGGAMFVTAKSVPHPAPSENRRQKDVRDVLPMQADINAAANLALRAIAHPGCADLHHRLRTLRVPGTKGKSDTYVSRESRRFGKDGVAIELYPDHQLPREKNSNLFFDQQGIADFGRARLACDSLNEFSYASGPGLWTKVNKLENQWARCAEINLSRLASDDIPM